MSPLIIPKHNKYPYLVWLSVAVALALLVPTSSLRAMPDDDWCRITGNMRFDQVDRLGQVRAALAQHRWDLLPGLFSRGYPVPASLEGRERVRALRVFHSIQLISASARGDLRAVDRLLAAGADPNLAGNLDYITTPLAMAALCDRPAVARRLISAGARVNYRFSYANSQAVREGNTALMWASMGGSLSVVRLLLNRGARADLRDGIYMHGEPPRQRGATALEISMNTDFATSRAIQQLLRARLRRH